MNLNLKKKILPFMLAIVMVIIPIMSIPASAYINPTAPTTPGLWIREYVLYATKPSLSSTSPAAFADPNVLGGGAATFTTTPTGTLVNVQIPTNATYVMFRFWDVAATAGGTGGNWSRKINGTSASHIISATDSGGRTNAFGYYYIYNSNQFTRIAGVTDTFTVNIVRTAGSYTITYNITWY